MLLTESTWLNINLDCADEGRNWDTVMSLVTTLEMILTGLKKNHLRVYFVAFLMSLSKLLQFALIHRRLVKNKLVHIKKSENC